MELKVQKRLSAQVMGCSEKRVIFDPARLNDIKEAITKKDIKLLVKFADQHNNNKFLLKTLRKF